MDVIAHRGLDLKEPNSVFVQDSTLSRFQECLQLGIGAEFDIQLLSGGDFLIWHDQTLDRFTDFFPGKPINTLTHSDLAELRQFDETLVTFLDLLPIICQSNAMWALHVKGHIQDPSTLDLICECLGSFPTIHSRLIVFDLLPESARHIKTKVPNVLSAASVSHDFDKERFGKLTSDTLLSLTEFVRYKDLYDVAWLDEWDLLSNEMKTKQWYCNQVFEAIWKLGKKVALVTPELHKTPPLPSGSAGHPDSQDWSRLWRRMEDIKSMNPDIVCTDHSTLFKKLKM